eukprot:INCI4034.2.p1 GENE.INCI4034.2~~INCI4034.2.p1  ORF type:complete len:611 (-),score=84.96 INCI4034.2:1844-3676(-)
MPTSRLASVLEARLCSQGSHGGDSSAAAAAFRTALQHQQAVSRHFQRTKMHNGHRSTSGRGSAGKNVHTRTDCVEFEVLVDGTRQPQSMAAVLFDDLVWPLAVYLYARTLTTPHGKRLLVGLGGAGGSGKSVTCALLAQVVNALHRMMRGSPDAGAAPATTSELCTAVSMDAYHFTNDYLLSQPIGTQGKTLKSVKGRPETFNVAALVNDLRRLAEGGQVLMPVYDRCLHDPVQEVHAVKLAHRLVLVEGLYVGVYAQQSHVGNNREEEIALRKYLGDWSAVQSILDVTAYLQVPESVAVRRLLRRKTTQANPKPRKEILAHINTVDVPTLCQLDELASRNCEFIFNVGFADPEYDDTARLDSVSVQQPKVKPLSTHSRRSSGTNKNTILVVGLNPALQKTWEFSSDLALGEVNRASSLSLSIGGKGQQLAHACAHAQGLFPCRVSLCQFLGGPAGDQIATMLDCFKDDIEQITVRINAATRSCHTLLDGQGGATELIEPSGRVSQEEREQLMADIAKQFLPTHEGTPSRVGAVAIAGTFPPGITGVCPSPLCIPVMRSVRIPAESELFGGARVRQETFTQGLPKLLAMLPCWMDTVASRKYLQPNLSKR